MCGFSSAVASCAAALAPANAPTMTSGMQAPLIPEGRTDGGTAPDRANAAEPIAQTLLGCPGFTRVAAYGHAVFSAMDSMGRMELIVLHGPASDAGSCGRIQCQRGTGSAAGITCGVGVLVQAAGAFAALDFHPARPSASQLAVHVFATVVCRSGFGLLRRLHLRGDHQPRLHSGTLSRSSHVPTTPCSGSGQQRPPGCRVENRSQLGRLTIPSDTPPSTTIVAPTT